MAKCEMQQPDLSGRCKGDNCSAPTKCALANKRLRSEHWHIPSMQLDYERAMREERSFNEGQRHRNAIDYKQALRGRGKWR